MNADHLAKLIVQQTTSDTSEVDYQKRDAEIALLLSAVCRKAATRLAFRDALKSHSLGRNEFSYRDLATVIDQKLDDAVSELNRNIAAVEDQDLAGHVQSASVATGIGAPALVALGTADILTGGSITIASLFVYGAAWLRKDHRRTEAKNMKAARDGYQSLQKLFSAEQEI